MADLSGSDVLVASATMRYGDSHNGPCIHNSLTSKCLGVTGLEWHLQFDPRVAYKRYATLEWHLPSVNLTLACLTKGLLPWNGTCLI